MNWKISKIRLIGFKAFSMVDLEIEGSSLLTLDGPNGFGKTTIFDAIELLLTGKIERVKRLFSSIMMGNTQNYKDNLYWNTRSGEADLTIRIEFSNEAENLVLARRASVTDLLLKENNRADKFEIFKLHELVSFDSEDFSDATFREESFIEQKFGENFKENYSHLNYLEQGQNEYLFSTRVDKRKDALNKLTNTTAVIQEIEKCKKIKRRINSNIINNKLRSEKSAQLTKDYELLKVQLGANISDASYEKLSTIEVQPEWDKQEPFSIYSKESLDLYLNQVNELLGLIPSKVEVQNRLHNERIENYISKNSTLLRALVQIGNNTTQFEGLNSAKKDINQLKSSLSIIGKGALAISYIEIETISGWNPDQFSFLKGNIEERDALAAASSSKSGVIAEIARLKQDLIDEHFKLFPDEQDCPLCGADWNTHQNLLEKIQQKSNDVANSLNDIGKRLLEVTEKISENLETIRLRLTGELAPIELKYDAILHELLTSHQERLGQLQELEQRLKAAGTQYPDSYTIDAEVTEVRLSELSVQIRSKKIPETEELSGNWKSIITSIFSRADDFYLVSAEGVERKLRYITSKANEARSEALSSVQNELTKLQNETKAAVAIRKKIDGLEDLLTDLEKKYSEKTISDIELIFHIYSGRLIQNYQRGLGLFIESRDGKQLRFATAEGSEHDAILSMSSGQISALSLAFFFSLNKVYSKTPIIMIDDPSQSLDEVNIASLTDLLRCELKNRQLIVSSHEEDISSYMRYRFARAGLPFKSFNMQRLAKGAESN